MHIHILGICGTFMAGVAALAKQLGHQVTGADQQVYPPMSSELERLGIKLTEGYAAADVPAADLVLIGNALSRGNPAVEAVLERHMPYKSGAQWLHDEVLQSRWVLAVAGTHGKTTTASMLSWLLEAAGLKPGFLVGGLLRNFGCSARLGETDFFVIEADEYDTAFFDKRSKFVHYCPSTLIINNLEFDHADIFPDLAAIQRQFQHLLRVVPGHGQVLHNPSHTAVQEVLAQGCWSERESVAGADGHWQARLRDAAGSEFEVYWKDELQGVVRWSLVGQHNVDNALMAIAAAHHVGVLASASCAALSDFQSPKRRLELLAEVNHCAVYDDFAHHPTAIATTLAGLRAKVGNERVIAVLEPRSNTMKAGVHADQLAAALASADAVYMLQPAGLQWDVKTHVPNAQVALTVTELLQRLVKQVQPADAQQPCHVVLMSNGGFENLSQRFINELKGVNHEV